MSFVEVSCGALPENLLESELFGHVKGSFTSAIRDRQGRFEAADGGTIFLDEIDAFSPHLQVKLLKVLQDGEFEKVGDTQTIKVDARVLAATNQKLNELIAKNTFREDLYYRLNVIPIFLPPLRDRKDDLPLLVDHFLKKCSAKISKQVEGISEQAIDALTAYNWPGNVRELENIIERAVILSKSNSVELTDLPDFLRDISAVDIAKSTSNKKQTLKEALKVSEKEIIINMLSDYNGNRKKVALALGINRTTLYNKMRDYELLDASQKDLDDA